MSKPSKDILSKWNESDMIFRWPPEFLEIVGKHSKHWNYSKNETLLLLDDWLQDYIEEAEASLLRRAISELPEKDKRLFPGIEPGQDPVRETCYAQGRNEAIDECEAMLNKLLEEVKTKESE